jgi:hypothetical protein
VVPVVVVEPTLLAEHDFESSMLFVSNCVKKHGERVDLHFTVGIRFILPTKTFSGLRSPPAALVEKRYFFHGREMAPERKGAAVREFEHGMLENT